MSARLSATVVGDAVHTVLAARKPRNFPESVELQVALQKYDVWKDRRFSGSLCLPHVCRPRLRVCLIADLIDQDRALLEGCAVEVATMDDLRGLRRNKKLIKKRFRGHGALLASESLIKTLPRVVGPQLSRMRIFPTVVTASDRIADMVRAAQSTVKFQLRKSLGLNTVVGHVGMAEDELRRNLTVSVNFLVSLLKRNWANVRRLYIKTTMGQRQRIY
jgi:large subunit ribosomal protein L10Ae